MPPPRVWGLTTPVWPKADPGELSPGTMVQRRLPQDSHQGWEVGLGTGWPGHCSEDGFLAELAFRDPGLREWAQEGLHLPPLLPNNATLSAAIFLPSEDATGLQR